MKTEEKEIASITGGGKSPSHLKMKTSFLGETKYDKIFKMMKLDQVDNEFNYAKGGSGATMSNILKRTPAEELRILMNTKSGRTNSWGIGSDQYSEYDKRLKKDRSMNLLLEVSGSNAVAQNRRFLTATIEE